jgi:hypothetical protein
MEDIKVKLSSGQTAQVSVSSAALGSGVMVVQRFGDRAKESTVTCTCTDASGKTYSTTKECSGNSPTCDCSTPSSPKITC